MGASVANGPWRPVYKETHEWVSCNHAHARFLDRKGGKITVAAHSDLGTQEAPWWYDYIASKPRELAQVGFTAIMYPLVAKTQSGYYPTDDGYGVFDNYDSGWMDQVGSHETRFGNRE
jgi:hypothetical protein